MSEIIIPGADGRARIVADNSDEQFDLLVDLIAENLAPSSQRVYRHTYEMWRTYTASATGSMSSISASRTCHRFLERT